MGTREVLKVGTVYRNMLRAVKKHIGNEDAKKYFREYVTEEFRKKNISSASDLSSIDQRLRLAQDYIFLLNSIHHQKDLLFSYNIAIDRSDEMKKKLAQSAASVGLRLPEPYQP